MKNLAIGLGLVLLLTGTPVRAQTAVAEITYERVYRLDFGVPGEVGEVHVKVGEMVAADALLAALDDERYVAAVAAAVATVEHARLALTEQANSFARSQVLYDEGSLATVELNLAEIALARANAKHEAARAALAKARNRLRLSRIYSPDAGVILGVARYPGERFRPDTATVATITMGSGAPRLSVPVDAPAIGEIAIGARLGWGARSPLDNTVTVDSLDWYSVPGRVLIGVGHGAQLPVAGTRILLQGK